MSMTYRYSVTSKVGRNGRNVYFIISPYCLEVVCERCLMRVQPRPSLGFEVPPDLVNVLPYGYACARCNVLTCGIHYYPMRGTTDWIWICRSCAVEHCGGTYDDKDLRQKLLQDFTEL